MTLSRWAIHHVDVAHWSNGGSLSSSYLLTQLMEVCICISLKWVKRGPELDSIRAGRSLSHCTNETIHHCFVCLYAPSHEQLMCCRRFAAFLLFLYLTFLLSLSHFWGGGGAVTAVQTPPADCNYEPFINFGFPSWGGFCVSLTAKGFLHIKPFKFFFLLCLTCFNDK